MIKFKVLKWISLLLLIIFFISCVIIREGEVGVKCILGKYVDKIYMEGLCFYNFFFISIIKIFI